MSKSATIRLIGRELGYVDLHLASSSLYSAGLWTLDIPLARVADSLGIDA